MATEQASLRDLVECRAAQFGKARRTVWHWALKAIAEDVLPVSFPEGMSLDTPFDQGGRSVTWRDMINSALHAIENYDPSKYYWARTLMLEPSNFDRWLKARQIGIHPKRTAGAKATLRAEVASFIEENYSVAIPTSISLKKIAHDFKTKTGVAVSERTVSRALGRK